VLGISRARVRSIVNSKKSDIRIRRNKMNEDKKVLAMIEEIVKEYPFYGYRRVAAILRCRYNLEINRKAVYRIMKESNLLMPVSYSHKRLFRGIAYSNKTMVDRSNALWGIDMTYIWCGQDGWCYLHGVIDHFDKTLLGYYFSRSCKAIGGVIALGEAASKRPVDVLELRSDNGCHYGSKVFRAEINRLGIKHTRTMVNTPKGNAVIERFFRSLKEECVWQHRFINFEEAKLAVERWIEEYNLRRPHQALNYLAPCLFYERTTLQRVA
jgi:putative transposase